jgi:glycoside/pentoside/hexuronide:cation symporter, GPH family
MIAYGLGQGGESLRNLGAAGFLLFYYQQVLGVPAGLTALVLTLSLIVDALIDPLVGAWSDRVQTRWGRRHPFMVAGMVPLGVLFYLTFSPPQLTETGYLCWLLGTVVLTRVALSIYHVPYTALAAEMSQDYMQRSTLFSIAVFFGALATMIGPGIALRAFFPTTAEYNPGLLNPDGYRWFAISFAVAMMVMTGISVIGTWRQIPHLTRIPSRHVFSLRRALADFREAFSNRSFRVLFFGFLLATLMAATEGVLMPFMGPHFWGLTTEQLSLYALSSLAALLVSLPLVPLATRRYDKKKTLIGSCLISIGAWHLPIVLRILEVPWFPANGSPLLLPTLLAISFVGAAMAPMIFATVGSMFADITDEHELEVGERREGTIFAARSLVVQLIYAAGVTIGGFLLDMVQFPKAARAGSVPADVLRNLGLIWIIAGVFSVAGVLLYSRYRLDRQRHAQILTELAARRAAGTPAVAEARDAETSDVALAG